ncbi:tripartite tricarboxylate transporter substrate binding protein BugD [Comamonas sp. Y33R10-2]|uniref:tripartite tricarboxylate transporter substrate-binding protein n=1 Tax=Comamonas sp. Y33R10-2 TaxID=2853257 RepID=UPI001C5C870C|nr:tripartite tricarboxylate transporter substrate-binding protein [Comamonas sp. Y33R10-2]QXZ09220.1 tripartite tricarboxylate transporter substrate binding protein BugD [Comamonas sp. Y33R10-2]
MKTIFKIAAVALAATAAISSHADTYPVAGKSITIIVPFTAGGPTDKVARDLAESMRKQLGNATIVIDNTDGAGSSIGTAKASRAKNDGYTLLLTHIGMSTIPTLYRKLSFNVLTDFEYAGIINDVPMTLIGRPTLPAKNFAEVKDWVSKNQGKVNLANAGVGSASHLCGLMFQSALQQDMTPVPYKGAAPAIADLMGNQVDLLCDQTTNTTSQIAAKKVQAYAVTTTKQLTTPALKDLPTLQSVGLKDFNVTIWHGLYAPKGTPADVVKKINEAMKTALKDPEFIKRQEALGAVIASDDRITPAGHKKFVEAEIAKWGKVIKAAGIYAD